VKTKIINEIVGRAKVSPAQAADMLGTVVDSIFEVANREDYARVPGFGTFRLKYRKGRTARNPRTGEDVQVAGRHVLTFKAAKVSD
jgi:nucleoid DNA-binding protein